jgi:dolichol-phosphate mannosyltransferase
MLKALAQGYELVVGSRYVPGGGTTNWGWQRRFTSWTATKMAEWLVGIKICDPMSGYFMLRRSDFLQVKSELKPKGFKILLEIMCRLKPVYICEIPYAFRVRVAGQSKLSTRTILAYLAQLWRLGVVERFVPATDRSQGRRIPRIESAADTKTRKTAA